MKNQENNHDDIILEIIVWISILFTYIGDNIKCLISPTCNSSIPGAGNSEWQSISTKTSVSGKENLPPLSQSIKSSSVMEDQKKADGGTTKDILKSPTASSTRSKRSRRSSRTKKSTEPMSNQILDSQQQLPTGTSTLVEIAPGFTLLPDPTTNEL